VIVRSLPADRRLPLAYVALGDSTVYGLGASSSSRNYVSRVFAHLRIEYPAATLVNRGTCMATAAEVLARQLPDTILDRPDVVTLSVGPNDLRQGHSPQEFARRVEVILERIDRETRATVIVNRLPDMAFCPRFREPERSMVAALTRHYNHALQHVTDSFGIDLVDIGIAEHPEAERQRFFCDDGYHPSDDGYAAWATAIWASLRRHVPERQAQTLISA
jgi:acyl-CoA thioesterase-1